MVLIYFFVSKLLLDFILNVVSRMVFFLELNVSESIIMRFLKFFWLSRFWFFVEINLEF